MTNKRKRDKGKAGVRPNPAVEVGRLVLRRHDRIGANDAEEDRQILSDCFVDAGDLAVLKDCKRAERIVVGRTGSGKSALLLQLLAQESHAIPVAADNLALSYISNSNILRFFESAGLSLEVFYKLIWRHAFAVELLKHKFGAKDERKGGPIEWLRSLIRPKEHREAIDYLEKWGDKFWEETESRVKDLTTKTEQSLKGTLDAELVGVAISTGTAKTLSNEVREQVVSRGQKAVNQAHVPALSHLLRLLEAVFDDGLNPHFIIVDRLDESWVNEDLRYKLIMALLETVKDFRQVSNVKLVVALRVDLMQRVFARARGPGFQEEKLAPLFLRLEWTRDAMVEVLNARINHVFRDRYAKSTKLTFRDLFAGSKNGEGVLDYIIERTLLRPRDLIAFVNECLDASAGKSRIAMSQVHAAEQAYSRARLQSVSDEWYVDFPNLLTFAQILLKDTETPKKLTSLISLDALQDRCLALGQSPLSDDELSVVVKATLNAEGTCLEVLKGAVSVFHMAGILGLKIGSRDGYNWYNERFQRIRPSEICESTSVRVHPMFHSALGSRECVSAEHE